MTVVASAAKYVYTGDGTSVAFPFPALFLANNDLLVGVDGVLQLSGYTVSGAGNPSGGTVTFSTAPANGVTVVLLRKPAFQQLVDFVNGQTVLEGTIETALDRLTMMAQYLLDASTRTLRVGDLDTATSAEDLLLPNAATRANTLLGFDAAGLPVPSSGAGVTPGSVGTTELADLAVTAAKLAAGAAAANLGFTPAADEFERPGVASPATLTLIGKMSQIADIRDWDAVDLTGSNDEASTVQAAVNETSGLTNPVPVVFPGCKIALGSTITLKNGTAFEGAMKAGGSYDTKPTWFHITHTGVGFTNENNTGAQRFSRIATYRTQPTPGGGAFTPNANDFDFDWVGAQDIIMEDVHLHNPTKGIHIRGRQTGAVNSGRITLRGITGQPLQEGVRATHCLDAVFWDEVHFWPFWSQNSNVITYTRGNGTAFNLGRMDNPKFGRLFCFGYQRGMIIIQQSAVGSLPTGTVSLMYAACLGMDNCGVGFLVNTGANGATGTINSLYAASDPAAPSVSAENLVWCLANNTRFKIDDLYGQYSSSTLLGINGTGNVWTIDNARSTNITGTNEYSVDSGNTLRLLSSPLTSAGTVYSGAGVIETPDMRSWTPTVTAQIGSFTTLGAVSARYRRSGRIVRFDVDIAITTNGTAAGDVRFTLPFASTNGRGYGRETNVTGLGLAVTIDGGVGIITISHTNAYPGGNGTRLRVQGEYEAT